MPSLLNFYEERWNPALSVLADMEARGCFFDVSANRVPLEKASSDCLRLETEWYSFAGDVNPASTDQLSEFLYKTKGWPVPPIKGSLKAIKKTKANDLPTAEASLDWLYSNAKNPKNKAGIKTLLQLKKATGLKNFLTRLPEYVDTAGYLHASFGPDTETGRLSCKNPNLQNIPADDPYGIRRAFIPPRGYKLIVSDYSQLELYVMAHFLITEFDDHTLVEALASGDIYGATAKSIWPDVIGSLRADEIKHSQDPRIRRCRAFAKSIVLGVNYGKTSKGLAVQLDVSEREAESFLQRFHETYPSIRRFQASSAAQIDAMGYTRTLYGRLRHVRQRPTDRDYEKARTARQATNGRIQGSAAEIVFDAMNVTNGYELQLQVHDELVFRCLSEQAESAALDITRLMESCTELEVPLKVETKVVSSWAEAKG